MMADELEALARRCEAAEGSSDELDLAIVQWARDNQVSGLCGYEGPPNYDCALWLDRYGPITASLDAAMSLMPKSDEQTATFWQVGNDGAGGEPSDYLARVLVCSNLTSREYRSVCATPALALCAAALRARNPA